MGKVGVAVVAELGPCLGIVLGHLCLVVDVGNRLEGSFQIWPVSTADTVAAAVDDREV